MIFLKLSRWATLTVVVFVSSLGNGQDPSSAGSIPTSINVSFKFDPGPTYGGPRWMPPPFTSGVQVGKVTIDARVQAVDSKGKTTGVVPQWTPENAEIVSVAAIRGDEVRITVKRAGESKLIVSTQQVSRALLVKAKALGDGKALQVQISAIGVDAPTASADILEEVKPAEAPADNSSTFGSNKEKQSYALGVNTAKQIRMRSIEVDADTFIRGFRDSLGGGKTLLTEQDVGAVMLNLRLAEKKKQQALKQEKRTGPKISQIKISFKQGSSDPSGLRDAWVSSSSYTVVQDVIQAKAEGISSAGDVRDINPIWIPTDPDMIAVMPRDGHAVTISVKRPGESKVTVASNGKAKDLTIRARYVAGTTMQLEISQ